MISRCSPSARTSSQSPSRRVHLSVIDGIEACIGPVDWSEERKQMYATEEPGPFPDQ